MRLSSLKGIKKIKCRAKNKLIGNYKICIERKQKERNLIKNTHDFATLLYEYEFERAQPKSNESKRDSNQNP